MKIRSVIMLIIAIYVTGIALLFLSLDIKLGDEVDTIAVNEVVKLAEINWGKLNSKDFTTSKLDFVIIDSQEKIIFSTSEPIITTINDAIKKRATIIDVIVNRKPVGKVIFPNNYEKVLTNATKRIYIVVIITFTALALLCISYILYLNSNIFKPFSKLQTFAQNVALGKLNIPLEMDRKNLFGAFSESFDLMREELEKARRNEYLANRSKKELVASLSHDIKTPVSSIKAVSELMLVLTTDEKERHRLNTIYYKAEQINLLVSDMFHATLEELNELKVNISDEDSNILVDIIHNVNYFDKITYDPIPECIISIDEVRLQQVFDNILGNSYKYANTAVYISLNIISSFLVIEIVDGGQGVDPDELPLLFNKFHRGKNAEGQAGSGLGLYISKYLIERMDGDISCENLNPGFKVTLKIKLS